ncbi:NAD(P)H-dependent glycerol-3-phosphate dehydrogenase [Paroceanicella profunda]|uniref:NAD(P)H-dependent glycerol-3-phosphate dehydrogenase n=1 Tax=Paroceanicella profunda TaxID=2579971 RepID=UPI0014782585|nr:NAD(P)H-dependent glycerol-3-phosphate dehydrogenase [Paroceanicella profunda]
MIHILGAGAFGSALATTFREGGAPVALHGRGAAPERAEGDILLAAVPAGATAGVLAALPPGPPVPLVLCAKGLTPEGLALQSQVAAGHAGPLAALTGPGFAADLARGLPTALTLACAGTAAAQALQRRLSTRALRLYLTDDIIGAQLGGALKNVFAIACGAAIGAGLGDSARAALMTRGFAEMTRLGTALGGRRETFSGLSGLGDLSLTCNSPLSRNFALGHALGRGAAPDAVTQEGRPTAAAALSLARRGGVEVPIITAVAQLLSREITVREAMAQLLARPLTTESKGMT